MNLRIKYLREIIFCCVFRLLNFIFDILWVINFLILDEFWVDDPRYGTLFLLCDWYFLLQENILFLEENVLQEFLSSRYNAIWIRNLLVFLWLWVSLKHIFGRKMSLFTKEQWWGTSTPTQIMVVLQVDTQWDVKDIKSVHHK